MDDFEPVRRLGELVKRERVRHRLSQKALGQLIGKAQSFISSIEGAKPHSVTGALVIPSDKTLADLALALHVPVSAFHEALGRVAEGVSPDVHHQLDAARQALEGATRALESQRPEIEYIPDMDELFHAGWDKNLPKETREEIIEFIRKRANEHRS